MKKIIQLPLLITAVLLLGACSTVGTRIEEKANVFYSLDPNTRARIAHGDIDIGYTPDMVYIALGQPDARRSAVSSDGQTETWIYRSYYDDFGGWGGAGWGGWGGGWGPGWGYHRWYSPYPYGHYRVFWEPMYFDSYRTVAEDDIRVTFRNGKVIMVDQART